MRRIYYLLVASRQIRLDCRLGESFRFGGVGGARRVSGWAGVDRAVGVGVEALRAQSMNLALDKPSESGIAAHVASLKGRRRRPTASPRILVAFLSLSLSWEPTSRLSPTFSSSSSSFSP